MHKDHESARSGVESIRQDRKRTPEAKRQTVTRRNERNDKRIRATMTLDKIAEHKAFYGHN